MRLKSYFSLLAVLIILTLGSMSCATTERSGLFPEDELSVTRKYVGNFIDYRHTEKARFGDPHLIWIKTTQDSVYGIISAYSRKCDFIPGERIYIRRVYQSPGVFGYWEYQIENDKKVWYKISEFQYGKKVLAQSWF